MSPQEAKVMQECLMYLWLNGATFDWGRHYPSFAEFLREIQTESAEEAECPPSLK